MANVRTVVVAGAGIAGLSVALALVRKGFRVICLDKVEALSEVGAGLQISPNASRLLLDIGAGEALARRVIVPSDIQILSGPSGRALATIPLGEAAEFRYGAPYWVIHRGELQSALRETAANHPDIEIRLGEQVEDHATHANGLSVVIRKGLGRYQEHALALVGADGVWSTLRQHMNVAAKPRFGGRTAWRGTIDASLLPREFAAPRVRLWMGIDSHLVAYPMKGGRQVNVVAVVADDWSRPGWSEPGDPAQISARFGGPAWSAVPRMLIGAVEEWRRWALFEVPVPNSLVSGACALIGDAAHAMVPFLAQGACMAIEDAAVLAQCLAENPQDAAAALRRYDALRAPRVTRVQNAARQAGRIYHLSGPARIARNQAMRVLGGQRLLARNDWIYDWRLN